MCLQKLLARSTPSGYLFISELSGDSMNNKMDHLVSTASPPPLFLLTLTLIALSQACFVAGTLALGSADAATPEKATRDMETAAEITRTCYGSF